MDTATAGTMVVTFDRANDGTDALANGTAYRFQGAALVQAGYAATST